MDRAYRIGQNKDVIVYRLMTCGTVEEKIYRKQVIFPLFRCCIMNDFRMLRYVFRGPVLWFM